MKRSDNCKMALAALSIMGCLEQVAMPVFDVDCDQVVLQQLAGKITYIHLACRIILFHIFLTFISNRLVRQYRFHCCLRHGWMTSCSGRLPIAFLEYCGKPPRRDQQMAGMWKVYIRELYALVCCDTWTAPQYIKLSSSHAHNNGSYPRSVVVDVVIATHNGKIVFSIAYRAFY